MNEFNKDFDFDRINKEKYFKNKRDKGKNKTCPVCKVTYKTRKTLDVHFKANHETTKQPMLFKD